MSMLELTKIFLHNWHRFRATTLEVQDGLYLAGHNASGKSTILDALQVIFLADLDLIKFNSSAQERSERTLDGFVRGKILDSRWLRQGGAIGYIAVEFTERSGGKKLTLGCCIEAAEKYGKQGKRLHFILKEPLDPALFLPDGQPLSHTQLKPLMRNRPGHAGHTFESIHEYQDEMREVLGHLNPRFFDLFRRAMSFGRIKDVGGFIEQWLLPEHPLELDVLQKVIDRLSEVRKEANLIEKKLGLLAQIMEKRTVYFQRKASQEEYSVLLALLKYEEAIRTEQALLQEDSDKVAGLHDLEKRQQKLQEVLTSARAEQRRLQQMLYSLDAVKRRKELLAQIGNLQREIREEQARKRNVLREIQQMVGSVSDLLTGALLEHAEAETVRAFVQGVEASGDEIQTNLTALCGEMASSLDQAWRRVLDAKAACNTTITQLRERAAEIAIELRDLQETSKRRPALENVERLRDALVHLIGSRPDLLCEQLEIPDITWQNAVEAMLDWRRFLLIVPPNTYERVLDFLDDAGQQYKEVGVLDLERVLQQPRAAQHNSLALQVRASKPELQVYIDAILGAIITCSRVQEIRQYRRAITANLMYYSEWTVRGIDARRFQPWWVGERAQRSQIEDRQHRLQAISERLTELNVSWLQRQEDEQRLDLRVPLTNVRYALDKPFSLPQLAEELAEAQAAMAALDLDQAREFERLITSLEEQIGTDDKQSRELAEEHGRLHSQKELLELQLRDAQQMVSQRAGELGDIRARYAVERTANAETLFQQRSGEGNLSQAINNTDNACKRFTTEAGNLLSDYYRLGCDFNLQFQFAGMPDVPHDNRYLEEQQRLAATELPKYQEQIAQAEEESSQELREHVLHLLRERITNAKLELKRMNDALNPLTFHGDRYRFEYQSAPEVADYYQLIEDAQVLGAGSLFESEFYAVHKDTFDRFYDAIVSQGQDAATLALKKRLTDYRTYLKYDIQLIRNGEVSKLSRIMGQQSGGETQTPFYVAIAASFVQLYNINLGEQHTRARRAERPTIRLAVFDEAFNQMDQDRIGATLDLFHSYGLQVITATPLERCEYLAPRMCTSLVLTGVGDGVLIEEYRNYAARLQEDREAVSDVP
jgi:hypothetical protein